MNSEFKFKASTTFNILVHIPPYFCHPKNLHFHCQKEKQKNLFKKYLVKMDVFWCWKQYPTSNNDTSPHPLHSSKLAAPTKKKKKKLFWNKTENCKKFKLFFNPNKSFVFGRKKIGKIIKIRLLEI